MKSIASKKAGPGGPSSYISHNLTRLYMHCNFGLSRISFQKYQSVPYPIRACCRLLAARRHPRRLFYILSEVAIRDILSLLQARHLPSLSVVCRGLAEQPLASAYVFRWAAKHRPNAARRGYTSSISILSGSLSGVRGSQGPQVSSFRMPYRFILCKVSEYC